jgi:hypothetical protein
MITLQQLLMSDSDLSGGTQTGKGTDGAQDFLALLAGALSDATGKGNDAPLTLADLKAAGSKLSPRCSGRQRGYHPAGQNCRPALASNCAEWR